MPQAFTLALDKSSARTVDVDGRLRVESSNITKAVVNPYFGKEIPGWESLGLDPARIYNLLRDPAELEKAASTFTNVPLLIIHKGTTADNHDKSITVGTVGDAVWDAPYVKASLCVWTAEAIAGIQSKQQTELSCGYRYRPDMTPGTYEGQQYDGVMRDIIGNHVALVEVGRAGSDVVVADHNPFPKAPTMKYQQRLNAAQAQARQALSGLIAEDADLKPFNEFLATLIAKDEDETKKDDAKAEDGVDDDEDEDKKAKMAGDEPGTPQDAGKTAMDAASVRRLVTAEATKAAAAARADMAALSEAQRAVAPLCGHVALDSAEAVYRFALDQDKVDHKSIKEVAALKAIFDMHAQHKAAQGAAPAPRMGMDAAAIKAADARYGDNLSRFGKI